MNASFVTFARADTLFDPVSAFSAQYGSGPVKRAFPYLIAAMSIAFGVWATMGAPLPSHPDGGLAHDVGRR